MPFRYREHPEHPRRLRRILALSAAVGVVALGGCAGDTLFDPAPSTPGGDGPVVAILSPTSGSEIVGGQRVPVRIEATDPDGVSSITLRFTGPLTQTLLLDVSPPRTDVTIDTAFTAPAGTSGTLRLTAVGEDTGGEEGPEASVTLSVSDQDGVAPSVRLQVEAGPRMELTDEIRVTVSAVDNPGGSGIVETRATVLVSGPAGPDTLVLTDSESFSARADTVVSVFTFGTSFLDERDVPDTLHLSVFGLAFDEDGNCGASVADRFTGGVPCEETEISGTTVTIGLAPADPVEILVVSGRTSLLPGGGIGADLVVDSLRSRAYVSNLSRNLVHVLNAATGAWVAETFVGSQPWGMTLNADGDSLAVANSGGTSISHVSLAGTPREDLNRRLVTHNTPLFEISEERDGIDGFIKLDGVFIDFSDRPQFIAQDAQGRLLYSTRPTAAAGAGTVRVVTRQSGWVSAEARILLLNEDIQFDSTVVAIANVDSISIFSVSGNDDLVEIYDHKPGFPDLVVQSGVTTLDAAIGAMVNNPDSDITWGNGTWRLERLALRDTTFVAASGDREWVAFGANEGPITLWDASASRIHSRLLVADLVNNASERVTGLDLNRDGSLGAARGALGSYYWNTDLRLLGSVGSDIASGGEGSGVALHPEHPSFLDPVPSSTRTVSFVGGNDHTIRILDTVHFTERGVIHIRDNVVGVLRAGPPLPSDNDGGGANCTGQDCVVAKLYALTDAGGVVVIDVRRRDIGGLQ